LKNLVVKGLVTVNATFITADTQAPAVSSSEADITALQAAYVALEARVAALEAAT
jgi:cell division protein FtsB